MKKFLTVAGNYQMILKMVTTTTYRQFFINDRRIWGYKTLTKVSPFAHVTRQIKIF